MTDAATDEARGAGSDTGSPGPTAPSERIVAIDALRGFALLGILVINVWFFSMPIAAASNPTAFDYFTGANYWAWVVSHVFFELKFVTLFSLLFGAGIVLFTESKEREGQDPLGLHYRRTLWLGLIGLGHAYLLWYGDILVTYAICGFVAVHARHWAPRKLLGVGLGLLAIASVIYASQAAVIESLPQEQLASVAPTQDQIDAETATYRGGWLEQMEHRVPTAFRQQTGTLLAYTFWRTTGVMLFGMALLKLGVLSNDRSTRFYRRLVVAGAGVGLPLILAGVWYREYTDWAIAEAVVLGSQFNYWGSLGLAAAYLAGIVLWCRWRPDGPITRGLAAVGRTAFSNYLLQTVLATSIFYGHGLGLFGAVSRVEQLGIVVAIWAVQVPLSVLWLRYFRFGPVEWVWRTLTYGERQPLRKTE